MKEIFVVLTMFGLVSLAIAQDAADAPVDYGDQTSVTLMVKAWEALGERKFANAVKLTERCAELYEDKAREMQAALNAKPSSDMVNDYWALNDVGTCYFIQGEALSKLRKYGAALVAYKVVMNDLYYSQAWDPKGWHWSPADAAAPKVKMLEARQDHDF